MNVMFGIDLLPFQGSVFLIAVTQGVALGYHPGRPTLGPLQIGRRQRFALASISFLRARISTLGRNSYTNVQMSAKSFRLMSGTIASSDG